MSKQDTQNEHTPSDPARPGASGRVEGYAYPHDELNRIRSDTASLDDYKAFLMWPDRASAGDLMERVATELFVKARTHSETINQLQQRRCHERVELKREIERLLRDRQALLKALRDAVSRPMGVVPDSAEPFWGEAEYAE